MHYKINIKGRKSEFDSNLEIAWSPSYLKRLSYFKIQRSTEEPEDRSPDGRTRGDHAPKRVVIGHDFTEKTRQMPHFHGLVGTVGVAVEGQCCTGTLDQGKIAHKKCMF